MKKTKITTLTTAALAATILATTNVNNHTVKADSTDDQTATKAQTPKEVAQTNVDNAKKDVENAQASVNQAQNDLNSAQAQATTAENNYNQQSEAVNKAQDDVNTKASTAKEAQSKADSAASLVSEAKDPKKVKEANDAVKDAEDKVTQANAKKSEADQAVAKKNEDITTKSEAASNAQKAVASASAAKSEADKAVSDAQKALNGTGINEAKTALDEATKKVNDDTATLNKAKEDQQTQQAAYDEAKKEKDAAEKNLAKAQADQAKAEKDLNEITKQLDAAEKARDAANKNKILIPDIEKYKKAWSDYEENGELTQEDIDYINSVMNVNQYKSSEEDKKVVVDAEHMTDDQIKELSIFAVNIINNVRRQLGYKENITVSNESVLFAKKVAKNYHEDAANGTWVNKEWHDTDGLIIAAASMPAEIGYGEAMGPVTHIPSTMDELKKETFNNLNKMIFASEGRGVISENSIPTYEFDHASAILKIPVEGDKIYNEIIEKNKDRLANKYQNAKQAVTTYVTVRENVDKRAIQAINKILTSTYLEGALQASAKHDFLDLTNIAQRLRTMNFIDASDGEFDSEVFYSGDNQLVNYDFFSNGDAHEIPTVEIIPLVGNKYTVSISTKDDIKRVLSIYKEDLNYLTNISSNKEVMGKVASFVNEDIGLKLKFKLGDYDFQNSRDTETLLTYYGPLTIDHPTITLMPDMSKKDGYDLKVTYVREVDGKDEEIEESNLKQTLRALIPNIGGPTAVVYSEGLIHILPEDGEGDTTIYPTDDNQLQNLEDKKTNCVEKLNLLQSSVENAQSKATSINTTITQYDNLTKKINSLNKGLTQEKQVQNDAKKKYDELTKSHEELTRKLVNAQSKQTEAQNKLDEANATKQVADEALTTAQNELGRLNQNVKIAEGNVQTAQQTLKDANNHVNELKNADAIKSDADSKLTAAKDTLTNANEALNKEKAKLPVLEQAKQVADDSVAAAQANLDTANVELDTVKTKLKDAQAKLDKLNKTNAVIDSASTNSKNGANKVIILNPAAVVVDKEGNTVTTPKTLPAGSQTTSVTPETKTINGKDYVKVGNDEFVPANAVSNIDAKNSTVELKEETEVVDKDGKTIKQPVLAKEVLESSDIDFTDAPVVTINGKKYYQVAENQYVPTSAIKKTTKKEKSTKPTKVKLTHNAFVYDKNGKVVKSKTAIKFIRRGKTIKPVNAKTVTIKGKKYYQVGKNQFIKAANAKIKTHPVKIKAVLKASFKAVDLNGKHNGKTIKSGKKYHFNEKRTINGKTYYKIIWTNNWIPASKLSIKK